MKTSIYRVQVCFQHFKITFSNLFLIKTALFKDKTYEILQAKGWGFKNKQKSQTLKNIIYWEKKNENNRHNVVELSINHGILKYSGNRVRVANIT